MTSGEIEQNDRADAVSGSAATGRRLPTRRRFSLQPLASIAFQILRALKSWRAKRRAARMRRFRSRRWWIALERSAGEIEGNAGARLVTHECALPRQTSGRPRRPGKSLITDVGWDCAGGGARRVNGRTEEA